MQATQTTLFNPEKNKYNSIGVLLPIGMKKNNHLIKKYVDIILNGSKYLDDRKERMELIYALSGNGINKEETVIKLMIFCAQYITSVSHFCRLFNYDRGQVTQKIQAVKKKYNLCGIEHRKEKYVSTKSFIDIIKPKSILDVCSGPICYYKNNTPEVPIIVSNDINPRFVGLDYNIDMFDLTTNFVATKQKFDVVDLDTYAYSDSNMYTTLINSVSLAQKGLIVTTTINSAPRLLRSKFNSDKVTAQWGITRETPTAELVKKFNKSVIRIGREFNKNLILNKCDSWGVTKRLFYEIS